jgi:hypothetical protein
MRMYIQTLIEYSTECNEVPAVASIGRFWSSQTKDLHFRFVRKEWTVQKPQPSQQKGTKQRTSLYNSVVLMCENEESVRFDDYNCTTTTETNDDGVDLLLVYAFCSEFTSTTGFHIHSSQIIAHNLLPRGHFKHDSSTIPKFHSRIGSYLARCE